MLDLDARAKQFHEDGFVIIPKLFRAEKIAELEQHLQSFIENVVPRLKPGQVYYEDSPSKPLKALHRIEEHSDYFRLLMRDTPILEVVRAIFPEGEIIPEAVAFFAKSAGAGSETPPHQDNTFQHWDPPEALTVTIAMDESTAANGVLICQRGSHKLGLLPHRPSGVLGFSRTLVEAVDTKAYPEVQLCMKPGDLAVHHINTIHRSRPNKTGRHRRQLAISYRSSQAQKDLESFRQYMQDLEKLHEVSMNTM
jgi:phytanoyl-CoA hydroxylase